MLQKLFSNLKRISQVDLDPSKTLWVGVDVGSLSHTACLGTREEPLQRHLSFINTRDGANRLVTQIDRLQKRHKLESVIVGMEPTGTYWKPLQMHLLACGMVVVLVSSKAVKANRKTLEDSSKTDRKDAYTVWDLLRQGKALLPVQRDPKCEAAYQFMQRYEDARTRVGQVRNQLHAALAQVFPELNARLGSLVRPSNLRFLQKNPTPKSIRDLGKTRFLARWRGRNGRRGKAFFEDLYNLAKSSLGVQDPTGSSKILIQTLAEELQHAVQYQQEWFEKAKNMLHERSDYRLLLTVHGIGDKIAVGLLSSLGSVQLFSSGKQWVKLAGLHVVKTESGLSVRGTPRISREGKAPLRTWLYQAAVCQIRYPGPLRDLYQRRLASSPGKGARVRALMAVADKLVRMVFAMLRDEQPYDATRDQVWKEHFAR